jgi:protein phosphatase
LHFVAARRLARGHLTVVDATNVQPSARKGLIDLAKRYHAQTVAIVLDVPEALCKERNAARADRNFGDHVIPQQHKQLRRSLKRLKAEGFRRTFVLRSAEEAARVSVVREKLWTDRREEVGPFDIIGDVHGCFAELERLLTELGYDIAGEKVQPPPGRKAVFVGDLVDRGPDVRRVLALVMRMVKAGSAICVPGNHDARLVRTLRGRCVRLRCMARRPASRTSSVCRCAATGQPSIAGLRGWSTGIRRWRAPSGSIIRLISIPAVSLVAR